MKKASSFSSTMNSIDEQSINTILDNGINQLGNNKNNYTYALNNDIISATYDDTFSKNKEFNKNSISNPFISQVSHKDKVYNLTTKQGAVRDPMIEGTDYCQKVTCYQNELHLVKMRLNDEIYLNAELKRKLENNNRLFQEKEFKIADLMRQIDSLNSIHDDFANLKHDYNKMVIDYHNSEKIKLEQQKLILALQKDLDSQRQRSFNTIDYLNKQKGVIELDDVNNNRLVMSTSKGKSRSQGKAKSRLKQREGQIVKGKRNRRKIFDSKK